MAHQMGGFDADKSSQVFGIPEGHTPMAMIAIGYQTAREDVPEERQERNLPETANPAGEHFFFGKWGAEDSA